MLREAMTPIILKICYSYTMPTRAVWDLFPEPEGEGNISHAARGGMV